LACLGPPKPAETRRAGVELKRVPPLAFLSGGWRREDDAGDEGGRRRWRRRSNTSPPSMLEDDAYAYSNAVPASPSKVPTLSSRLHLPHPCAAHLLIPRRSAAPRTRCRRPLADPLASPTDQESSPPTSFALIATAPEPLADPLAQTDFTKDLIVAPLFLHGVLEFWKSVDRVYRLLTVETRQICKFPFSCKVQVGFENDWGSSGLELLANPLWYMRCVPFSIS
jgi:hypothetical protein